MLLFLTLTFLGSQSLVDKFMLCIWVERLNSLQQPTSAPRCVSELLWQHSQGETPEDHSLSHSLLSPQEIFQEESRQKFVSGREDVVTRRYVTCEFSVFELFLLVRGVSIVGLSNGSNSKVNIRTVELKLINHEAAAYKIAKFTN